MSNVCGSRFSISIIALNKYGGSLADLVSLEADAVPVQVNGAEPGVDLQRLGQQPRPHVPHVVPTYIQHLFTQRSKIQLQHTNQCRFYHPPIIFTRLDEGDNEEVSPTVQYITRTES